MSDYSRQDILDNVSLEDIEPYEGKLEELPQKVKDCAESVKEDQDVSKSQAIAICRDELDMSDSDCPDGKVLVNGRCVEKESVETSPGLLKNSVYQLADLESEPIEREELGDGKVAYRNMKILQSGTWTDSSSRETVWYSPRGLENMELTDDNAVNIMHDDDNEVSEAGHLENLRAEDGSLYADIIIDKSNSAGAYADENLEQTLKTQGANGFGGPSVEIPPDGQKMEYNESKGMRELVKGKIDGLGLVRNPASKPTSFARQSSTRAVALSDSPNVMRLSGDTTHMSDNLKAQILSEFTAKELAGPQEVEEEAQSIADELDVPVGDVLEVLDPLFDMDGEEEEGEEMEEDEEGESEENEGEDTEEEDDGDDVDIEMKVESLEERVANMEDMMEQAMAAEDVQEELEEFEQDLADAESVKELEEAKEDLEKRLSELEDEPENPRSLSDGATEEESEEPGTVTIARSYDSRSGTISR